MNNKYKGVKGYEPFDIKELNKNNLNKVFDIEDVPSSLIEQVFTKTVQEQEKDIDVDKDYTDDEENKIIELNNEIEKVLKKEQDVLFETPASPIETEKIKNVIEDDDDIPLDITVEIEKKSDDDIPIEMSEELKREITAVLEYIKIQ